MAAALVAWLMSGSVAEVAAPARAQASDPQCRTVKKFKGSQSVDVVLCRDADGVFREATKALGSDRSGFRGRVIYDGQFTGTTQRIVQRRRQQYNLDSLLREALGGGQPKQETSGNIRIQLDFSGSSVQGTVSAAGAMRFTLQLSGLVENGFCKLTDQSRTVTLEGQCSAQGFQGDLDSEPERGTRARLQLAARATSVTDFDERDLVQAGQRAERERELAAKRQSEERWLESKTLLANAGDLEAMYLVGAIYEGEVRTEFVRRDIGLAMRWYQKAADLGHAPSMYSLGFIYYKGTDGMGNDAAALAQFTRCAAKSWENQGHCHLIAGSMHYIARGTPENRGKAIAHWRSCAKLGNQDCADRLAKYGS